MQRLAIRLLGKPELSFDGTVLKWKAPPKTFPLLAMLGLHRGHGLARRQLAIALWPDDLESEGLTKLRRHLYHVNRSLPAIEGLEWILQARDLIVWNDAAPAWFDVRAFRDAIEAKRIREAVELYRGDLLEESYDELVMQQREPLRAEYVDALLRATREVREARDYALATAYAEKLLAIDEWSEDGVREWMAAKYESGDRSAALAMYERFARKLQEEFGAPPTTETTALREAIRAGLPLHTSAERTFDLSSAATAKRGWKLPFVGRSAELQTLGAAWSRAARGSGGMALVSGEAGIGKSRLASELTALAQSQGGSALVGTTSSPEAEPYQAIAGALRSTLPLLAQLKLEPQWLAALARLFPELGSLLADIPEDDLPPERARSRLFEAIARAFERLGRMRPLCVVLEDLHCAGPATIEMLESLGRRLGTVPVFVLATYRSDEAPVGSPLRRLRASLVSEQRAVAVPLSRLDAGDVRELVASQIADEDTRGNVAGAVTALSDGNPLFASQLLEEYLETQTVPDRDSALREVGDAIATRAARLAPDVRIVAEIAATIGETFSSDLVTAAGGLSENATLDALGELMDRGFVREAGANELQYAFSHALIASTVYERSPAAARKVRHRRIAELLERDERTDAAGAAAIAHQWQAAGDRARAGAAFLRAAAMATHLFARADAVDFARSAVELIDDPQRRIEASFALAKAEAAYFHQTGDRARQRTAIDEMLAKAEAAGNPLWRFAALRALGAYFEVQSRLAEALEPLHAALQIANDDTPAEEVLDVRFRLAHTYARLGRYDDAQRHVDEIEAYGRLRPSALARVLALRGRLAIALSRQDAVAAEAAASELLELAIATADMESEIQAHTVLGWVCRTVATAAEVRAHYDRAVELSERLNFVHGSVAALVDRAQYEATIGNVAPAFEFFDRALSVMEGTGADAFAGFCLANRSRAHCAAGNVAPALEDARRAREIAERIDIPRLRASAGTALGIALVAAGEPAEGLRHLALAVDERRRLGSVPGLCDALCEYARALLRGDTPAAALPSLDELSALYAQHPDRQDCPIRICYALANGATLRGDEAAAASYRDRARRLLAHDLALLPDDASRRAYAAFYDETSKARVLG
ncbi:MAG: AAA family ATPase [Candidatus Eremiobacteraeota bacterium]|nr:AAA family ATPase [Candidatus Eremiobacteraeota bacterium]